VIGDGNAYVRLELNTGQDRTATWPVFSSNIELNTGQDRTATWPVFSSNIEPNRGAA
jgi:hypothetical protein